mgnify:CR=1 FL=1
MSKKSLFERQRGVLFKPKLIRQEGRASSYLDTYKHSRGQKLDDYFINTNIESTSSFRYGDKPHIVSSQELKIDWENFENHTFFHSAVANVNEGFDKIINFYPIEGNLKEIEQYEDDLTGYEKYILSSFPKNVGYLNFSGTQVGESLSNGTQISVKDRSGVEVNQISRTNNGAPVLDPKQSPFAIEFFIKVPEQQNDNQVIIQKRSSLANNFTLALSSSSSSTTCEIHFGITSGSNFSIVSGSIKKGSFSHVYAMYDLLDDARVKLLINDTIHSSSQVNVFENLNYNSSDFKIGTGDNVRLAGSLFTNKQTFSGSIDDLRYFHSVDSVSNVKKRKRKSFYPKKNDDSLKLYYRFNEPYGDYTGNNLVLDSSGNSLHSYITNFEISNRLTSSDVPVTAEDLKRNPILFPNFSTVQTLNSRLLTSASLYDDYNPNLIINLIPQHYFEEGTNFRDYTTELTRLESKYTTFSNNTPAKRTSEIPSIQLLMKLLLSYGKFFDEIKMLVDAVTSFRITSYDDFDTTPDPLLIEKAKLLNVTLPQIFSAGNVDQIFEGVNLADGAIQSAKNLNQVKNLIWRRILSSAPRDNLRKGTVDSIKGIFRSAGIEPDNILTFREYGGSKIKSLRASKELKRDVYKFINFTGSLGRETTSVDNQGYPTNAGIPKLKSGFLSGSRLEVGRPLVRGTFVSQSYQRPHGISNNASDGLFTSGSFTYEGLYDWENGYSNSPESVIRLHATGTASPSSKESCLLNLVADDTSLRLFFRDSPTQTGAHELFLTGVNVFDKDIWQISFGKKNSHDLEIPGTSSYFLRAAKQLNGDIINQYTTSSFFEDRSDSVLKNVSTYNTSGSFLVIGSQSFQDPGSSKFLNDNSLSSTTKVTNFHGFVTNVRFFSKNTNIEEFQNRARNFDNFGVKDPKKNYSFTTSTSGSFERLIINTDAKQASTGSSSTGVFRMFDFSQNNLHMEGTNFDVSSNVIKNFRVNFEVLSDKFDLNHTREKVRVRSFEEALNLDQGHFSSIAPVHEILPSEESLDDNRLSVDMSVMRGLNENMLRIFNDFSSLENAYGNPNLVFSEKYQDTQHLREIYSNNILEKLDLQKYRELFKWVDSSFTDVIYSLIPRTTNFLGVNFIYESHVLERNRFRYLYDEIYLKSIDRDPDRGNIFLSQFVGQVVKH